MKRWIGFMLLVFTGELYNFAVGNDVLWLASVVAFLVFAPFVARWAGVGGYQQLGFHRHSGWALNVGWGLATGALFGALSFGWKWWLGALTIEGVSLALMPVVSIVVASILGALVEELFFRGYLLKILPPRWAPALTLLAGAAIFAAGHWHRWGIRPVSHFVFLFVIGMALVYPAIRTGSIWLSLGLHAGHNLAVNGFDWFVETRELAGAPWIAHQGALATAALMAVAAWAVARYGAKVDPGK